MAIIRFPLDEILGPRPVRERDFRTRLNEMDLTPYQDKAVMIPWIHHEELPLWVYLMTAAKLAPVAAVLSFGGECSPIVLTQRQRLHAPLDLG